MSSDSQNIERTAADWLARGEAGLSANEQAQLAAWLEADVRHERSYRALQRSWLQLDELRGSEAAARIEAELDDVLGSKTQGGRVRVMPWLSGALAASVVWLVAYFAWWQPAQANAPFAETAATEIGAGRTLTLPDGSTIQLNTDTAVDVLYTKTERRVRLDRGEALFKIAPNRARPFIVRAAGVDVRAVGTEFNVRLRAAALEVIVREGKVRVDRGASGETLLAPSPAVPAAGPDTAASDVLAAGQRVTISVVAAAHPTVMPATPVPLAAVEIERSLAWQNGRLVFESAPLSAIIAEFNRYHRRQLVIVEEDLARHRFGGTFVANDPDTFVELLRASYDVAVEQRDGQIVLRRRK
jgi:transmembrane sensor